MDERLLSIYLRDHHAASAGGVALARRAVGPDHSIARQIARDRETLESLMRQLDVSPSATKVGLVRIAEVLGRLKLNGRMFKRSPLSRVVELEMLLVGIRGKEALWTALQSAGVSFERIDLDALADSARAQAREVDELRLSAAADTFGDAVDEGDLTPRADAVTRRNEDHANGHRCLGSRPQARGDEDVHEHREYTEVERDYQTARRQPCVDHSLVTSHCWPGLLAAARLGLLVERLPFATSPVGLFESPAFRRSFSAISATSGGA